jgi:hypothetical protein
MGANKRVANKVISTTRVADLPSGLSTKARGSIRKWRADKDGGYEKEKKRKHDGRTAAAIMAPGRPKTPPDNGNKQQSSSWQPAKDAKHRVAKMQPAKDAKQRMAKMLDKAKARLRNDSKERTRVEQTMTQMNMAPSEQQSMEFAASALPIKALYKDGSSGGTWQGGINKNTAASVTELVASNKTTANNIVT